MIFFSFFKTLVGKEIAVELKNDVVLTGTLVSVDQFLNIKLSNVSVVDSERYPQLVSNIVIMKTKLWFIVLIYNLWFIECPKMQRSPWKIVLFAAPSSGIKTYKLFIISCLFLFFKSSLRVGIFRSQRVRSIQNCCKMHRGRKMRRSKRLEETYSLSWILDVVVTTMRAWYDCVHFTQFATSLWFPFSSPMF